MPVDSQIARTRLTTWGALALSWILLLPPIVWLSARFPNVIFEDDAYFYLKIAWNLGQGAGSTFDGQHITNGYHLLWTGLLIPIASLSHALGLGKIGMVAGAVALALALVVSAAWTTFERTDERVLALLVALLCGLTMESAVLAALLLVSVRALAGAEALPPKWLLVSAALVPLARIDFCFMVPALVLCERWRDPARTRWAAFCIVGTLVGVALHLGIEWLAFDSLTSVSSAYKSDIARARGGLPLLVENLASRGNQLRLLALTALAGLALVPTGIAARRRIAVLVALLPVMVHLVLSELRDWYVLASLTVCLFYAVRGGTSVRLRRTVFVGIAGALTAASLAYLVLARNDMARTAAFLRDAEQQLQPSDVVYQVDGAGFPGFWLSAQVVNGDGLVNSFAYRELQREDRLAGYLQTIGARFVMTNEPELGARVIDHHGLVVSQDEVTLRIDTGETRHPHARFRLYELRDVPNK